MRAGIVAIILLLLGVPALSAELTIIVSDPQALIQLVTVPTASMVETVTKANQPDLHRDTQSMELNLPARDFVGETGGLRQLVMVSGAVFTFTQQMRIGETPAPFMPGLWPIAELRSARSPAGVVLVSYTTTIDDPEQAIWSHRLTAAQTAGLAGKNGITELSFSDAEGIYQVWYHIPTTVLHHITEEAN